ncbi:MAG: YHYH protein, partial [Ignavibacteria bacterium]
MNKTQMKVLICLLMFLPAASLINAQITPEIYSWKQNTNGVTGYNGIPADVQQVFYSANFSYVKCTGIPSYTIGPWTMNPNIPSNQNWTFKIARYPVADPTPSVAGNGQIGVLINGVVLFNSGDAMSYNNQNIWHRVAQYFEAVSFDTSGGHPAPSGAYHYHINMKKLYTPNSSQHSPILGYMFDGFPLYGPYSYSNTNGTGSIRRMKSGFIKRTITTRTTLPDGTVLPTNQWGPAVSTAYPLGCFIEDYEPAGSSDLDIHNGRFSVTPEYQSGIYAYFITIDSLGNPEFPYIVGSTYYGEIVPGNTPPGGH